MRKKLKWTLFISGLLIEFAAFSGDHAEEIPFVLRFITPAYCRAKEAADTLENTGLLKQSDVGFVEVQSLLMDHIGETAKLNGKPVSTDVLDTFRVYEVTHSKGTTVTVGTESGGDVIQYTFASHVYPVPNNQFAWNLHKLRERIEELFEKPNVLRFCLFLFIFGVVVELVAFYLEMSEPEREPAHRKPAGISKKHHLRHEITCKHESAEIEEFHSGSPWED